MNELNVTEKYILKLEKENKNLKEDFKRHIDRINELTNRIDKAIKYIEDLETPSETLIYDIIEYEKNDLLDILKGSDKE